MRAGPGEGDCFDDDPVGRAAQTAQGGGDLDPPHSQIQMPPARGPIPGVVTGGGLEPTVRADEPATAQGHRHDDQGREEGDIDDVHVVETQQALECSCDAHGLKGLLDRRRENP